MCRRCSFFDHVYFSVGSFCDVSERKKKSLFPQCVDAWPFSPTSPAEWGIAFLLLERVRLQAVPFLAFETQDASVCQGKVRRLTESSKLEGLEKKKKELTLRMKAGKDDDVCEVGSDTVSVASVRTKSCDSPELEDHGPERV